MRGVLPGLTLAGFLAGGSALAQEAIQPETVGNLTIPAGTEMVFAVDIALGHVVDGRIRLHVERVRRHRLLDLDVVECELGDGLEQVEVSLTHDSYELSIIDDRQVADPVLAHDPVRIGE